MKFLPSDTIGFSNFPPVLLFAYFTVFCLLADYASLYQEENISISGRKGGAIGGGGKGGSGSGTKGGGRGSSGGSSSAGRYGRGGYYYYHGGGGTGGDQRKKGFYRGLNANAALLAATVSGYFLVLT